jgi:3-dehydroquinate dehydratase
MTEVNTDFVQKQWSELTQPIIHVIQACNKEKEVLEKRFDLLNNGIVIMESRLQMEKVINKSEVLEVRSMMQFR